MSEITERPGDDRLGPDERWADLRPMIVYLALVGAVWTLAARRDQGWAFVLGLVLTAVWVAGFYVARNKPSRWFIW
jgi:hypothetical protein